nr:MAG TPA: hypothetical protein [Caudoviricetes sp.]
MRQPTSRLTHIKTVCNSFESVLTLFNRPSISNYF